MTLGRRRRAGAGATGVGGGVGWQAFVWLFVRDFKSFRFFAHASELAVVSLRLE